MAKVGRPRVLNEKKKSLILALLRSGCSRVTAARSVNCHPRTILNTAKRDPEFAEKLALGENAAELTHLDNINKAGREVKYWRASAWMLERLHPERFVKSNPDAITPSQITTLIVQIAEIIIQEIPAAKHRKQILKRFDRLLVEARFFKDPIPNPSLTLPLLEFEPAAPEEDAPPEQDANGSD
jgi:hypothetical protein